MKVKDICVWLAELFNDLGDCFSFYNPKSKTHDGFGKYRLLQPKWLTKAIYTIITQGKSDWGDGTIGRSQIEKLLETPVKDAIDDYEVEKYSSEEVEYILQVMRRFMMSYRMNDRVEMIPALCRNDLPEDRIPVSYEFHIRYEYDYKGYLPASVLHQLMVGICQERLGIEKTWRSGFNVHNPINDSTVIIDTGSKDSFLLVDVYTTTGEPAEMLTWVRNKIFEINQRLSLKPEEFVVTEEGDSFRMEKILSVRKRKNTIDGDERDYDIDKELLGMVYTTNTLQSIEPKEATKHHPIEIKKDALDAAAFIESTNPPILNNNYFINAENVSVGGVLVLSKIQEHPMDFLNILLEHKDELDNESLDLIGDMLKDTGDSKMAELGESIIKNKDNGKKKSVFSKLTGVMKETGDAADKTDKLYGAVTKWGPKIYEKIQKYSPVVVGILTNLLASLK